ncbi:hypothetical protein KAX02_08590 [candidate division WOR-3 bacterium]|nr:hypothetical protein [candidate division WOR-3 bacterium]
MGMINIDGYSFTETGVVQVHGAIGSVGIQRKGFGPYLPAQSTIDGGWPTGQFEISDWFSTDLINGKDIGTAFCEVKARFAKLHPETFNMEPYRRDMFYFNLFADPTMWLVKEPEVKDEN